MRQMSEDRRVFFIQFQCSHKTEIQLIKVTKQITINKLVEACQLWGILETNHERAAFRKGFTHLQMPRRERKDTKQ